MGRNSVEEIIVDSIAHAIGTHVSNLKMHGCGREDIDVRMLGMLSLLMPISLFVK